MDYVVLVKFASEDKARAAYDKVYAARKNAEYTIHDMALMKREDGRILMPEGYSVGADSKDDAVYGGLLGALIGFLGGPIGVLIGASVGVGAGAIADNIDVDEEDSLLYKAATVLCDGQAALVALVSEVDPGDFESNFLDDNIVIYWWDAEAVAAEVAGTNQVQNELASEARNRLRAETDGPSPQTFG